MSEPIKITVTERLVGFYLLEGIWAHQKPDYSKFGSLYWLSPEFSNLLEEKVVDKTLEDRRVVIQRDGMISYSDPHLLEAQEGLPFARMDRYSTILNALLLIMVSHITESLKVMHHDYFEVTHLDIIGQTTFSDGGGSMGIPNKSATNSQLQKRFLSSVPSGYVDCLDLYVDSPPRAVVDESILSEAIDKFFKIISQEENLKLVARTNKAMSEFMSTSFSDSLIVAWTPIEIYLYEKMQIYAKANPARFNADRKKYLSKDMTISEIIEMLEVGGQIDFEKYKQINKTRRARNKIIHEGKIATVEEASEALKLLEEIINEKTGVGLKLALGIRMSLF